MQKEREFSSPLKVFHSILFSHIHYNVRHITYVSAVI